MGGPWRPTFLVRDARTSGAGGTTMSTTLCLFTDNLEPSGVGEHLLTLAGGLREHYRVALVCPPTQPGRRLLARAGSLELETLPLTVRGDKEAWRRLHGWLRACGVAIFHDHAGVG